MVLDPFGGTVEATPNATFVATDFDKGTLSGLTAGMKYSVDSGANYVDHTGADTSVNLTNLEAGKEIKVIKKGNGTTTIDSAVQIIPVTRQAQPTGFTKTDATVAANNNGKIEGLTTDLEYRKLPATAWENVTGTSLENLEPATYELRTKAAGTALASENASVVIEPYVAPSNYEISLSQTTDLVFQQKETRYTAVTPETITITNTGDVATGVLNVELTGTNANDFELSAPTVADIAQSATATFTVNPKTSLAVGDYVATVKVSNANVAEKTFVVKFKVVTPGTPLPIGLTGTINISGAYKYGETLTANLVNTNNTGTLSYKWLEGSNVLATTQSYTLTANEIDKVLTVVVESSAQTGDVRQNTPMIERAVTAPIPNGTVGSTQPTTSANNDAKITGVNDTMEYKKSTDATWTPVPAGATVLENLTNGEYQVRTKETATHAAGPITTVTILAHGVTPPPSSGGGGTGGSSSSVRPNSNTTTTPAKNPTQTTLKNGEFTLKIGSKVASAMKEGKLVEITMDAAPFIQNGRTMVPLRYVAELLGLKVEWVPATKTAKLTADKVEILVPINKTTMTVNGKAVESDQMPILKENRTYLSISNIAKALGLEEGKNIIWDNNAKEVLVKK